MPPLGTSDGSNVSDGKNLKKTPPYKFREGQEIMVEGFDYAPTLTVVKEPGKPAEDVTTYKIRIIEVVRNKNNKNNRGRGLEFYSTGEATPNLEFGSFEALHVDRGFTTSQDSPF